MSVDYVEERDLIARPLRVVEAPMCSLLMAVRDAAGAERSDTPEPWRRVIRAHLTRRDYEVLAPLSSPQPTFMPSMLVCEAPTVGDALEQLAGSEGDLAREIEECIEAGVTDWRGPARNPRDWLRGLVLTLSRAWSGYRPIWEASRRQVSAEVERVASAGERRAHLHVLADLIHYGHVGDERWQLACDCAADVRLGVPDTGLTLIPLVAGSRASIVDYDGGVLRLVGYPLRVRASGEASLEALLGPPRARILRALDAPATNNRLADALQTVPSAATHHVSTLVAAGLVVRDRSNGSLRVRRTPRGDALLALYEPW